MKTLITRTISGFFFLIVMVGAIYFGPYYFTLLCLILMIIGLNEFTKLKDKLFKRKINRTLFYLSGISVFYFFAIPNLNIIEFEQAQWALYIIPITLVILFSISKSWKNTLQITSGFLYISVPFALISTFHFVNEFKVESHELLLGFFILLWCNDVFAYLFGTAIGRTKLAPTISPKKTWEGTLGGITFSILASYIISKFFLSLDFTHWFVLAIIISIFATLGDLLESKLKRQAEIKDSGKLMPGHGGVLDRFDGMLLSAPPVYIYLSIVL